MPTHKPSPTSFTRKRERDLGQSRHVYFPPRHNKNNGSIESTSSLSQRSRILAVHEQTIHFVALAGYTCESPTQARTRAPTPPNTVITPFTSLPRTPTDTKKQRHTAGLRGGYARKTFKDKNFRLWCPPPRCRRQYFYLSLSSPPPPLPPFPLRGTARGGEQDKREVLQKDKAKSFPSLSAASRCFLGGFLLVGDDLLVAHGSHHRHALHAESATAPAATHTHGTHMAHDRNNNNNKGLRMSGEMYLVNIFAIIRQQYRCGENNFTLPVEKKHSCGCSVRYKPSEPCSTTGTRCQEGWLQKL